MQPCPQSDPAESWSALQLNGDRWDFSCTNNPANVFPLHQKAAATSSSSVPSHKVGKVFLECAEKIIVSKHGHQNHNSPTELFSRFRNNTFGCLVISLNSKFTSLSVAASHCPDAAPVEWRRGRCERASRAAPAAPRRDGRTDGRLEVTTHSEAECRVLSERH